MDISNYSVKLHINDEVRRFVFSGTSFADLKEKCRTLANLPETVETNLKYDDSEGDKVTLSSDAELEYALSINVGQLLRLKLDIEQPHVPIGLSPPVSDDRMNWRARNDTHHKMIKNEWKQQKRAMRGHRGQGMSYTRGPQVAPVPPFDPSGPFHHFPPHHGHAHMPPGPPHVPFGPPHGHAPYIPPHRYPESPMAVPPYQPVPGTYSEPLPYVKKSKDLDARFISHQTYPDDTEVAAGELFEKTWRFRNTGTVKWPEGTVFLRVDRANELSAPDTTPVVSIEPNQETNVSVKMTSPSSAGRYQSYFKLCAPNGKKFGQRMRCQILAVTGTAISPERIDKVWEQLEAMGFVEKGQRPNTISSIILRENCDVHRIVREILSKK